MALTADELKEARKAFREIALLGQRKRFWIFYGIWFFYWAIQALNHHHVWMRAASWVFLAAFVGAGVYRWILDRRLRTRYAANIGRLRILREREPSLDDEFGDPFAYEPLLAAWNRRRSQRAILWRLDHFLSGKGWPVS